MEAHADASPESIAIVQGERSITWRQFEAEAALLAGALRDRGIAAESKVALCLHNTPEYLVAVFAIFKLRAIPLNVNYRYRSEELAYVLRSTDSTALLINSSVAPLAGEALAEAPDVRLVVQTDENAPAGGDVITYRKLVDESRPASRQERSASDPIFVLTGGTTGMPKAVMWRSEDFFGPVLERNLNYVDVTPATTSEGLVEAARELSARGLRRVTLPASPLMHGLGFGNAMGSLLAGGAVVLTQPGRFDPMAVWRDVATYRVTQVGIVGDAFGVPLAEALGSEGCRRLDLGGLERIVSAGAGLSARVKATILEHLDITVFEGVGSTEAPGVGMARASRAHPPRDGRFWPLPTTRVVTDDGRLVQPGSGEVGRVMVTGRHPLGYYKDPDKTASLFTSFRDEQCVVTGDFATIDDDGALLFLGRGSSCINTGGEKVFPEEVESVIKQRRGVRDCVVVGLPHERWGEQLVAVVCTEPGAELGTASVQQQVRENLADYKIPKKIVFVEAIPRTPHGKADHDSARRAAADALGVMLAR
jgi:fatty-acyl-CoA synthase